MNEWLTECASVAILCGAILYVVFMGAAALGMEVLLIVASGVCGFGSGMLW